MRSKRKSYFSTLDTMTTDESSEDVFQASSELRPPKLDCRHSIHLPRVLRDPRDSKANGLRTMLGRSFTELPFLTARLQAVIQAMCDATVLLHEYYRDMHDGAHDEGTLDATFQALANVRVGIQHALLSLTPDKCTEETPSAALMYRSCWLALLIFSDTVLFVTPVQSGIRGRLAAKLLQCLTLAAKRHSGHCDSFYVWAAVLGGMASCASGSAHIREAYEGVIRRFCGPLPRCRIDAILERCSQYMWWGVVMDQPARAMLIAQPKTHTYE